MVRRTARWFLSIQTTLFLLLIFVRGNEDAEDAYKNGRNLVLEYFLPINVPAGVEDPPLRREKRDVEGSGEDETVFSEIEEKKSEDNSTAGGNAFARLMLQEEEEEEEDSGKSGDVNAEGSGEIGEGSSESSETSSEESSEVPVIGDVLITTTDNDVETTKSEILTSTEMIFDKSEDFEEVSTMKTEETTAETAPTAATEPVTTDSSPEETTTVVPEQELTTFGLEESTTGKPQTTTNMEESTTIPPTESVTIIPHVDTENDAQTTKPTTTEPTAEAETTEVPAVTTTTATATTPETPIVVVPQPEETATAASATTASTTTTTTVAPVQDTATPEPSIAIAVPKPTEGPSVLVPVVEEVFQETKIGKKLEALPGNILQKENLSLAADPLLIANTRLMDSEENVQLSSSEPKRLGAYIVIGLILLSFSSLVGYITFRKRMNRKRQEFESNQESHDTEKALLSLSDYKDNSELEENHLKNNEITPIVVKSNSQINKFEKNTNFSSPKNLNTIANEKNIEKDNVLKSTAENLTQVIIEDSPKDLEEEKAAPNLEKLIVKTRIDQDSIPKKAIIINRSSAGYLPIPQDNS